MKMRILFVLMLTVGMMFIVNGTVFADDAFQDPSCDNIPEPDVKTAVGVLVGKFTAANDLMSFDHGNIHAKLDGSGNNSEDNEHLISAVIAYTNNLCNVNDEDLALSLKAMPCREGIAARFGYTNGEIAVIRNIKIKEMDFCEELTQMIGGNVQLLIMPPNPAP